MFSSLHDLQKDCSELQRKVSELERRVTQLNQLQNTVQDYHRVFQGLGDSERQVRDKESSLAAFGGSSSFGDGSFGSTTGTPGGNAAPNLNEEREALNALLEKQQTLDRQLEQKTNQLRALEEEESRRNQRRSDLQGKYNLVQEKLLRRDELLRTEQQLDMEMATLQTSLQQLQSISENMKDAATRQDTEFQNLQRKHKETLDKLHREQQSWTNLMEKMNELSRDIASIEEKIANCEKITKQLEKADKDVAEMEALVVEKQEKRRVVEEALQEKQDKVRISTTVVYFSLLS